MSSYSVPVLVIGAYVVSLLNLIIKRDVRIIDSDMLAPAVLYKDLTQWGGKYSEWSLSAAQFIFPDLTVYFTVQWITGHALVALLVFGIVQATLFVLGWSLLAKSLTTIAGASSVARYLPIIAASIGFLLYDPLAPIVNQSFTIVSHFGIALITPFALGLIVNLAFGSLKKNSIFRSGLLLFALSALTAMSDLLFIAQVALPVMIAVGFLYLLNKLDARQAFRAIVPVLLGTITGAVLMKMLFPASAIGSYVNGITPTATGRSVTLLINWLFDWGHYNLLSFLVIIVSLAYHLCVCGYAVRRVSTQHSISRHLVLISAFAVVSALASVASVVGAGVFYDANTVRYFTPFMSFPFYAAVIHAAVLLRRYITKAVVLGMTVVVIAISLLNAPVLAGLARYTGPYPELMQCLDQETARRNLKSGIATYWDSLYLTILSRNDVKYLQAIMSSDNKLEPYFWQGNGNWYKRFPPEFVVIDAHAVLGFELSSGVMLKQFGDPADKFECPGRTVYVYNRPSDTLASQMKTYADGGK